MGGVSILSNTVYSTWGSGNAAVNFQSEAAFSDGVVLRGNILASADGFAVCSLEGLGILAEDDHNLLFNGRSTAVYGSGAGCGDGLSLADHAGTTGRGAGSLSVDPAFVAVGSDFHLAAGSPAFDASVDLGLATDLEGVPRPQGAGFDPGDVRAAVAAIPGESSAIAAERTKPAYRAWIRPTIG